jgi:hypothetical protein
MPASELRRQFAVKVPLVAAIICIQSFQGFDVNEGQSENVSDNYFAPVSFRLASVSIGTFYFCFLLDFD